jgi:hypothetical protein
MRVRSGMNQSSARWRRVLHKDKSASIVIPFHLVLRTIV